MLVKIVLMEDMFEQLNKSLNEDPRLFTIIHGLLMRRVPFGRKPRPEGTNPKGKRRVQSMGG